PFDEPNVTENKENTARLLEHYEEHGSLPQTKPLVISGNVALYADDHMAQMLYDLCAQHQYERNTMSGLIAAQLNASQAGDYFALLAYLPATPDVQEKLEEIQRRLRHVTRRAITVGYGPRFLHSTGQLHKGGANNGVFVQFTCADATDIKSPDAPYSFSTLNAAQAAGDLQALQSKDRRVLRLHSEGDLLAGLQKFLDAIELAGERRQ